MEFKAENYGLLKQAAESLGWVMRRGGEQATLVGPDVTIVVRGGKAEATSSLSAERIGAEVNKLRVAYSQQVVNSVQAWAAQKGWQVQQAGPNKVTIQKGR